jgi:hypothetical protein
MEAIYSYGWFMCYWGYPTGEAITRTACTLENILSAPTAEALALLRGLKFMEQLGYSSVIIEPYSLELIQACNGVIEASSPSSTIMAVCFLKASSMRDVYLL